MSAQTFCGLGSTLKRPDHVPFLYYLHRTFGRYVNVVSSALENGPVRSLEHWYPCTKLYGVIIQRATKEAET